MIGFWYNGACSDDINKGACGGEAGGGMSSYSVSSAACSGSVSRKPGDNDVGGRVECNSAGLDRSQCQKQACGRKLDGMVLAAIVSVARPATMVSVVAACSVGVSNAA